VERATSLGFNAFTVTHFISKKYPDHRDLVNMANSLYDIATRTLKKAAGVVGTSSTDEELLTAHLANGRDAPFLKHWSMQYLQKVKEEKPHNYIFEGTLNVSNHNFNEAYVTVYSSLDNLSDTTKSKIFIPGRGAMNRAVHGDKVAVALLPKHLWKCPEGRRRLREVSNEEDDKAGVKKESARRTESEWVPTGQV
jgi:exoribonuclease R